MIRFKEVLLCCLMMLSNSIMGQNNLSNYQLLAHYSLIETNADDTGQNDTLLLQNVPFLGSEGVASNGIYFYEDSSGCALETPNIKGLNHDDVAFSVEFKLTDTLSTDHAIMIGGRSWRWLGASLDDDHQLHLIVNGFYYDVGVTASVNQWHSLFLMYRLSDSIAALYLDDSLIFSIETELLTDPDDKVFANYHGGNGQTFKGNLRNLKVYGPKQSNDWFTDDVSWIYRWNVLGGFGYEELHLLGDTVVLDQPCKILQPMIVTSRDPFISPDTIYRDPYYMYTSNDSVFYFFSSIFALAYNFNMEQGDSVDFPALVSGPEFSCPPTTFILDSVKVASIAGMPLRQQYGKIRIDGILDESNSYVITEGIGFTHKAVITELGVGPLIKFGHIIPENAFTCLVDGDSWQFCSYHSSEFSFNSGNEDCKDDLILPANELSFDDILISPNPSNGWMHINPGTHKVSKVKIYTSSGQLLMQLSSPYNRIQLPDESGIYFVQIFTDSGIDAFKVVRN